MKAFTRSLLMCDYYNVCFVYKHLRLPGLLLPNEMKIPRLTLQKDDARKLLKFGASCKKPSSVNEHASTIRFCNT